MHILSLSLRVLSREGGTAGGVPGGDKKTRRVLRLVGDTASTSNGRNTGQCQLVLIQVPVRSLC